MKISHDGQTVSFKTEPEALFLAEKSGAKSNTVRILDLEEWQMLKKYNPKKIIIQYKQEVFLRTITNIHSGGVILGKDIVIFSWKHQPASNETDHLSSDVLTAPSLTDDAFAAVTVSKNLLGLLQSIAHGRSMNTVIRELYEASQYQQFKAETAPATEEKEEDKKLALIGVSKGLSNILVRLAYNRSMDAVIRELYETYLFKLYAEEREPPIDPDQTSILIPRSLLSDLNWHRGNDTLPEFISKLLKDRTGGQ